MNVITTEHGIYGSHFCIFTFYYLEISTIALNMNWYLIAIPTSSKNISKALCINLYPILKLYSYMILYRFDFIPLHLSDMLKYVYKSHISRLQAIHTYMNFAIDRFLQFSFCVWIENLVFGTFIDKQTKNNYTRFDLFANIVQVLLKTIQNFHHRITWPNINCKSLCF